MNEHRIVPRPLESKRTNQPTTCPAEPARPVPAGADDHGGLRRRRDRYRAAGADRAHGRADRRHAHLRLRRHHRLHRVLRQARRPRRHRRAHPLSRAWFATSRLAAASEWPSGSVTAPCSSASRRARWWPPSPSWSMRSQTDGHRHPRGDGVGHGPAVRGRRLRRSTRQPRGAAVRRGRARRDPGPLACGASCRRWVETKDSITVDVAGRR